jgi:hypothetical protein
MYPRSFSITALAKRYIRILTENLIYERTIVFSLQNIPPFPSRRPSRYSEYFSL